MTSASLVAEVLSDTVPLTYGSAFFASRFWEANVKVRTFNESDRYDAILDPRSEVLADHQKPVQLAGIHPRLLAADIDREENLEFGSRELRGRRQSPRRLPAGC